MKIWIVMEGERQGDEPTLTVFLSETKANDYYSKREEEIAMGDPEFEDKYVTLREEETED